MASTYSKERPQTRHRGQKWKQDVLSNPKKTLLNLASDFQQHEDPTPNQTTQTTMQECCISLVAAEGYFHHFVTMQLETRRGAAESSGDAISVAAPPCRAFCCDESGALLRNMAKGANETICYEKRSLLASDNEDL